ncbi:hypothetical protein [Streptomyces sp. NPDC048272]|uniref:hypothetical protein n=1 Tax=Streptomyces sp. NPDC048272 TaxID=3154616 RepID=UPI003445EB16
MINVEAILIGLLSVAHTPEQAEHAAKEVLSIHAHGLADLQREFARKRYNDDSPPIPYAGYLGMMDAADSIDPEAA